ncbi:hypothetical protein A9Q97_05915 [Rhodospirillales bacterium 47_12_T64]|nr:hypothetical protein A9Q97_05915 [Rhodospirillales bacterium 47_12_T64]
MEQSKRDLNDMAVFAEIVTSNGISVAADRLGLPKSNVSRRLARLERHLGVRLLERNTRSNRLTSIGQGYADYCRRMVEEAEAADNYIFNSLDTPSGELRISASVLVGQQVIAPALPDYIEQYPNVTVSLSLTNQRVNLIEDGFDLAFRIGKNEDSGLISQALNIFKMRLYASPKYLEERGTLSSPNDLTDHSCLVMTDMGQPESWQLSNGTDNVNLKIEPAAALNDFTVLKKLALKGAGIALLPEYAVYQELENKTLQCVFIDWYGPVTELTAIYPSRRGATSKLRAFVECVKDYLAQNS